MKKRELQQAKYEDKEKDRQRPLSSASIRIPAGSEDIVIGNLLEQDTRF